MDRDLASQGDDPSLDSSAKGPRFGSPIDQQRLVDALWAGRRWIATAAIIGLLGGWAGAKYLVPTTYKATALLSYEGFPEVPGLPPPTQREIGIVENTIRLEPILRKVRQQVGIETSLTVLARLIEVIQDLQSGMINVTTPGGSAHEAAHFANALTEAFLDHQRAAHRGRIQDALDGLGERMGAVRRELAHSRAAYDQFRETHGIADLTVEQQQSITSAATTRAQADLAGTEVQALEAKVAQLQKDASKAPRGADRTASTEASHLRQLQTELTQARTRLSDDHPRIQALQRQIQILRLRLNKKGGVQGSGALLAAATGSRARSLLTTAESELEQARQRLQHLSKLSQEQETRVAQFSQIEGEASTLLVGVRVNETLLNELRNQRARLQDALRNPTAGFRVVGRAAEPEYPEKNKMKYIVAAMVPTTIVLLVLIALLFRELRGFRMRTASEVGYWGRGPVIGTTSWPRDPTALGSLVADMDDYAPTAQGSLLLVGATDADAELVHDVAAELNSDWMPSTLIGLDSHRPLLTAGAAAGPSAAPSESTALAPRGASDLELAAEPPRFLDANPWVGPQQGPALRRAARLADRVAVIVTSGEITPMELARVPDRLGRSEGIGYILVGADTGTVNLLDRVGPVDEFWRMTR